LQVARTLGLPADSMKTYESKKFIDKDLNRFSMITVRCGVSFSMFGEQSGDKTAGLNISCL
jgi:hypothetical protein